MAIVFNSAASGFNEGTVCTFELGLNFGSNKILIVGVAIEDSSSAPAVDNVKWNGTDLTQVVGAMQLFNGGQNRVDLWYLLDPEEGTYNVVSTLTGDPDRIQNCGAIVINGAKQQAPEAVANAEDPGAGALIVVEITTLTPNAWVIDCASTSQSGRTLTEGSGQTKRWEQTDQMISVGGTKPVASAGLTTITYTIGGGTANWGICCASFEPYAAAYPGSSKIVKVIGVP